MSTPTLLRDLVVLVGLAIPVVALATRLRVPSIVGFLLTGIAIGPHALGLIREVESVHQLAEVGVVLLLFAIGLELSLPRVMRLGRVLVLGGTMQVTGTIAAVALGAMALGAPPARGVLYGALAALSSTAIVLKVYTERGALDSAAGRIVIPIALFQDLCIIPLVLLVNVLGGAAGSAWQAVTKVGVAAVVVAALVLGGRVVIPRLLAQVAKVRSRELFTLSIVFLGVGAAFVTQAFGLSLALGAFLAGLVISESDYGTQALSDVIPFRDALTGIFFASVGMLLDLRFVVERPVLVVGAAVLVIGLKGLVATGAGLGLRRGTGGRVFLRAGRAGPTHRPAGRRRIPAFPRRLRTDDAGGPVRDDRGAAGGPVGRPARPATGALLRGRSGGGGAHRSHHHRRVRGERAEPRARTGRRGCSLHDSGAERRDGGAGPGRASAHVLR
jgi:CPA2 family monovalent cation:H+ antiporter-2